MAVHSVNERFISLAFVLYERFGAGHITKVVRDSNEAKIVQLGHDMPHIWGLLKGVNRHQVSDWVEKSSADTTKKISDSWEGVDRDLFECFNVSDCI